MSNSGPYSAQIQRAIAGLLAGNNTWTGTNTFTGAVIYSGGITTPSITFTGGQSLVGSTADVTVLSRSTNLQEFRLGPSGDYLSFQKGTGSGFIQTSSSDNLNLGVNSTQYWRLEGTTGHFGAVTDNVNDIGASGANRPRTIYVGTSVVSPVLIATETKYANRPATPAVGMLCNFSDSNTATWGATIAEGGANKVCGRYNGHNWTVVGV